MANDLNRCEFIGRLGADPETRYTANGAAVCNFRIAAGWKSKEKEGTEWIPIVVWGKLAEACQKYLIKGSRVYVSGSWRTRKWQDSSGQDRYTTEVVIDINGQMQMLDGRSDSAPQTQQPRQQASAPAVEDFEDSIPF